MKCNDTMQKPSLYGEKAQTVDKVANAKVFATFLLSKNHVEKHCPFLSYDWNLNICKGIYGIINHRIFNEVPSNDD